MAEIKKEDIFEPGTIEAPLEMAKNMDKLLESIQGIIKAGKQSEVVLETATSTRKLADETKNLFSTQTELEKVQKQFATSTQKLSDEYLANKRALNSVNDEVKKRLELSDREAKDITAKNASLKQLEAALLANRKAYADLTNEQSRNSKAGMELLNVIKSQDVSVKALRDSMGQAQAHVGGYREEIEKALGSLGKLNPELAETAETGISKFGLLTNLISGPLIAAFAALFVATNRLKAAWDEYVESTAEGQKAIKGLKVEYQAAQELGREWLVETGRIAVQQATFVKDFLTGSIKAQLELLSFLPGATKILDMWNAKIADQKKLNEANKQVREDEIILISKGSDLALEKSKAMFSARDKIRNTDIERLEAVDKAEKLILAEEALEIKLIDDKIVALDAEWKKKGFIRQEDQKSVDLLHDKVFLSKLNKEDAKELSELEKERNQAEQGFFDSGRRRQALRISATDDLIKRTVDGYKIELEANDKTQEAILHKDIEVQQRIIGNGEFSLEAQLEAQQQYVTDLSKLIDITAEKEKRAAADSALARVEVDTKALRAILDNEKLTALERTQAIFDERVKAVKLDGAYQKQIIAIDETASAARQKVVKDEGAKTGKIIADNFQYYIDLKKALNKKDLTEELAVLDRQLIQKEISLTDYEKKKIQITKIAAKADVQAQIEEQTEALKVLQKALQDKGTLTAAEATLLKKIQAELVESNRQSNEQDVENFKTILKRKQNLILGFIQEFQTLIGVANGFAAASSQAKIADLETQSKAVKDAADKELAIAGDNAIAKNKIQEDTAKKQAEIDKKIAEEKNKQAKIQRAADIIQAGVTFSKAILVALAGGPPPFNLVLAEITAAVAGIQLAAIAAAPLPKYELGTKNSVGGFAIVGEKGAELIKEPGKDWTISPDSTSMVKLAAGSEVVPHEETMRRLALSSLQNESFVDGANFALHGKIVALQETIKDIGAQTVRAIEESKVDFEQQGSLLYKVIKKADGSKQLIRAKSISQ